MGWVENGIGKALGMGRKLWMKKNWDWAEDQYRLKMGDGRKWDW